MNYQKSYRIFSASLYGGILVILLGTAVHFLWLIGVAVVLAGLVQGAIFYRCPSCGKSLDLRAKIPNYCPHCGKKLENRPDGRKNQEGNL